MKKYEVWVTKWSEEQNSKIQVVAGEFKDYMNAWLFAKAYEEYYHASTRISEVKS